MRLLHEFHLAAPIVAITVDKSAITIATNQIRLCRFNHEFETLYKSDIEGSKVIHQYSNAIGLSKTDQCIVPMEDEKHIKTYYYDDTLQRSDFQYSSDVEIECACFSHNAKFLAIGDIKGRLVFYRTETFSLIYMLNPQSDYINSIRFSKDDKYVAYCAFNKSLSLYDFKRAKKLFSVQLKAVVQDTLFIDNNRLLAILEDGGVVVYDIKNEERLVEINVAASWASKIIQLNERYVVIFTRSDLIYFFDCENLSESVSY